ncbi:uncharacterized protein [Amphiura filiformis]|uniref:uncharacterized protein n=1 Tax=Amphiura filiformis TaxID=82378 RepID=UPI003B20FDFF
MELCGFDHVTKLYGIPSLALKVGHSLKITANILKGNALMADPRDVELEQRCSAFVELKDMKWEEDISTHAHRTLSEKKRNNPKLLPVTEDIVALLQYVKNESQKSEVALEKYESKGAWKQLNETCLTHLIVFNRKRQGEVSKMKVVDYKKVKRAEGTDDALFKKALSPLEQKLLVVLWRVEIVGKMEKTVPMLLTNSMKDRLDKLMKYRKAAGVHNDNPYFFANESLSYRRGTDCLRVHGEACGAKNPQLLRSTKLRKQLAVVSQVMSLENNELDLLATFMGHDIKTHREYYRLPSETLQVARISKVLLAMENGDVDAIDGKGLADIQIEENEGEI